MLRIPFEWLEFAFKCFDPFEWFKFGFECFKSRFKGSNLDSKASNPFRMVQNLIRMLLIPFEWLEFAFEWFEAL